MDAPVDYAGFEVGDEYLLGYGMDWEGRYRNVRSIWAALDISVLQEDPLAFAKWAFPAYAVPGGPAPAR